MWNQSEDIKTGDKFIRQTAERNRDVCFREANSCEPFSDCKMS